MADADTAVDTEGRGHLLIKQREPISVLLVTQLGHAQYPTCNSHDRHSGTGYEKGIHIFLTDKSYMTMPWREHKYKHLKYSLLKKNNTQATFFGKNTLLHNANICHNF